MMKLFHSLILFFGLVGAASAVGVPFDQARFDALQQQGKPALVWIHADWCPTCKWNLKMAVDTPAVRRLVDANGVLPMLADWTDESPMIKQTLNRLGRDSIPVLAIYPAESADAKDVIILSDLITESQVLEALQAAGPSRPAAAESPAATTP